MFSHSVVSDSLRPHELQPARLLCPWGFPRQECWSGLSCPPPGDLSNLGSNPGLLLCRQILYPLSHRRSQLFKRNHIISKLGEEVICTLWSYCYHIEEIFEPPKQKRDTVLCLWPEKSHKISSNELWWLLTAILTFSVITIFVYFLNYFKIVFM